MEHFHTGPSSADLWSRCKAYLQMLRNAPEDEGSAAAREGTAAHHFSEEAIQCGYFDVRNLIGMTHAETGVTCDEDMADYCNVYTYRVKQLIDMCRALGVEVHYRTEYRVDLSHIYPGFFGTRDFHVIAIYKNWAIVIDLKFGRVNVSAYDNRQCMCYALDIIAQYPDVELVRFEIVQPRGTKAVGAIDAAEYTVDQLAAFAQHAAEYQAANHSDDIQEATAGSHCTYCPSLGMCRAGMQYVLAPMKAAKFNPNIMSAEEVEQVIRDSKLIKNFIDKAYVWGLNLARQGAPLKTLKMVKVKSREAFKKEITVEAAAERIRLVTGQTPDMDEIAPRRLGAISTIRKKYGDAVASSLTQPFTETLELRGIDESGTPEQSPMMAALSQPTIPLEK